MSWLRVVLIAFVALVGIIGAYILSASPGLALADAPSAGPVQLVGTLEGAPTTKSPSGRACAMWSSSVFVEYHDPGPVVASTVSRMPIPVGEAMPSYVAEDSSRIGFAPGRFPRTLGFFHDGRAPAGLPGGFPADAPYSESCVPLGERVVIVGCIDGGQLTDCLQAPLEVMTTFHAKFTRPIMSWSRFVALLAGALVLAASLAVALRRRTAT